jgi:outer membrane protein OmpA-like peptidoglycan-associated protein
MRKHTLLSAAVAVLASVSTAAADPAYKADDIVKQFANDLGATRGLCIGTEAECAAATAAPKVTSKATFDLVVNFDYNSDVLTTGAKRNLDEFAKALKDPRLSSAAFVVEGHTDGKGGDAYNLTLSERRAQAVVRYLNEKGVATAKLAARGYGKAKPKTSDPFDPVNRRVETRLRVE